MGFEQLGKKLAQLGQDTKSGMQKMGESYQVNAKLGDEKKALRKLYATIGKEVYKRNEEAPLEGLEDEFAAVKTALENISKLSEQLGKLKNVVYCNECGKEAARDEQFCSACGAKLPETEEAIRDKVKRDAKEAAGEAGIILEDIAGKTRDFVGGMADRADAFAKGVASRMAKEKEPNEEDIVDMPWEEDTAAQDRKEEGAAEEVSEASEEHTAEEASEASEEHTAQEACGASEEHTAQEACEASGEDAAEEASEAACSENEEAGAAPGESKADAEAAEPEADAEE